MPQEQVFNADIDHIGTALLIPANALKRAVAKLNLSVLPHDVQDKLPLLLATSVHKDIDALRHFHWRRPVFNRDR